MSILVGSWKASFSEGLDQDLGGHIFFDGKIQLWSSNWLVLLDHKGDPVIGRRVLDTVIASGSTLHIQDHFVRVFDPIEVPQVRPIAAPISVGLDDNRLRSWKITYSTYKDLDRGRMKSFDGILEVRKKDNFMILNNSKGRQIGCRFKRSKDSFHIGAKIYFSSHVVRMGVPISVQTLASKLDHEISVVGHTTQPEVINAEASDSDPKDPKATSAIDSNLIMSIHDSISLGLDFSHGIFFAADV
jgi:hypothetical protein